MDVLQLLLILAIIALAGFALFWATILLPLVWMIFWGWTPLIVGIAGGIWLWQIGHDNLSITVALVCFVVQFAFWPAFKDKGGGGHYYDPLEGKTKLYDKDGHVIGGKDKE